jgi:hypothetical protein
MTPRDAMLIAAPIAAAVFGLFLLADESNPFAIFGLMAAMGFWLYGSECMPRGH